MTRRKKVAPPPPCEPTGDMSPLPEQRYECKCGEDLRLVRMSPGVNDWSHETLTGERVRDDRPQLMRDDPEAFWNGLRERMAAGDMWAAQIYSSLTARLALGGNPGYHYHYPDRTLTEPVGEPPYCCKMPMWASPDGWACRVSGQLFPY